MDRELLLKHTNSQYSKKSTTKGTQLSIRKKILQRVKNSMLLHKGDTGIIVDHNIEVVTHSHETKKWIYMMLQPILIFMVCSSIVYCFISGLGLEVNNSIILSGLIILVTMYYCLFAYFDNISYIVTVMFILYITVGYIYWDTIIQEFYYIANRFIGSYNDYFKLNLASFQTSIVQQKSTGQFFLLYVLTCLTGIISYVLIRGKSILVYLCCSIPFVFLSFIIGLTPEPFPYIVFIITTISVFTSIISEKHGIVGKEGIESSNKNKVYIASLRVKIQAVSCVLAIFIFLIYFFTYSPSRYEKEFNADQVKINIQSTMKSITDGTFLKKFSNMFRVQSHGGLSGGELGNVGKLTFNRETALKVTTSGEPSDVLYLKGYVGEQYSPTEWSSSKEDKKNKETMLTMLNSKVDPENISGMLYNLYAETNFNNLNYSLRSMIVENIAAKSTTDYVPYNLSEGYSLNSKGYIKNASNKINYYTPIRTGVVSDLSNTKVLLQYLDMGVNFSENLYTKQALESYLNITLDKQYDEKLSKEQKQKIQSPLSQSYIRFNASNLYKQGTDHNSDLMERILSKSIFGTEQDSVKQIIDHTLRLEEYEIYENAYLNYVLDTYTKLPKEGLNQVKQLVGKFYNEYQVSELNGQPYKYIEDIVSSSYQPITYYESAVAPYIYNGNDGNFNMLGIFIDNSEVQYSVLEKIIWVKNYLENNTSYSLNPGVLTKGEDFVENFLFTTKVGYCMHYASAATVMLRAMGVPARYVEGYVVTKADYNTTELGNYSNVVEYNTLPIVNREITYTAEVKDTNAHAWTEVYLPGYGWVPIEVTPAYYDKIGNVKVPDVITNPNTMQENAIHPIETPNQTETNTATSTPKVTETVSPTATVNPTIVIEKNDNTIGLFSWYTGTSSAVKRMIQIILYTMIIVIITYVSIVVRKVVIINKRKRQLNEANYNQRVVLRYKWLNQFLEKQQLHYNCLCSATEYSVEVKSQYPYLMEKEFASYVDIVLKAKYQHSVISTEEKEKAYQWYKQFRIQFLENMGPIKRWYYENILIL